MRIDGVTAKQDGAEVTRLIAGKPVALEAMVMVECTRNCAPGVIGHWNLTFVPGAVGDRFLVKPRSTARQGLQAVSELIGEGGIIAYTPTGPGKLIVHFNGRGTCNGEPCEPRLSAAAEYDVVIAPLSDADKEEIINAVRGRLPVIPGGAELLEKDRQWRADLRARGEADRANQAISPSARAYDRAVGESFGSSNGWKPGESYTQVFSLPGGCGMLRGVQVVSTAFQNVAQWSFGEEGLPCGFPAQTSVRVFGEDQPGSVIAQRKNDQEGLLTLTLPVVDGFSVEIRYIDASGQSRTINTRCQGTIGPRGEVTDAATAPAPGYIRISIANVDSSRLSGDDAWLLSRLARLLAQHFGGWYSYANTEPVQDAQGRESRYSDILMGGVNVPAAKIAELLKPLADALGAKILVDGQNIRIQGADVPSREAVLPARLGGQRIR